LTPIAVKCLGLLAASTAVCTLLKRADTSIGAGDTGSSQQLERKDGKEISVQNDTDMLFIFSCINFQYGKNSLTVYFQLINVIILVVYFR